MCWVLVAMHHRALLFSALTGETVSGTSEALGQTKVPAVFQVWGHSWCPEPLAKVRAGEMVPLSTGGGCHQVKELQEEVSSCTASEMIKKKKARASLTPCSYRNQGAQLYWRRGRQRLHFSGWKMMTKPRNLWLLALTEGDQCSGSRWEAGNYLQRQTEPELADPEPHSSTRREQQEIAVAGNGGHSLVS